MRIGCRSLSRSWQMTALQRHLVGHTVGMQRFLRKQRKLGDLQRSSDTSTTRSNLLIQFSRANCLRELPMCLTFLYFSMLHDDETQFSHKSNSTTCLACVSWTKRSHLIDDTLRHQIHQNPNPVSILRRRDEWHIRAARHMPRQTPPCGSHSQL